MPVNREVIMKKNNRKQGRNVMAFLMLTVLMITTVLSGCSAAAPKTEAGTGSTVQEAVPAGETAQDAVPAEETAEDEACLMEHAISDESFKKWVAYIEKLDIVDEE